MIPWLTYLALCLYCMLDAYQTRLLLDLGAIEVNPLILWLVQVTGTWWVVVWVKAILLLALGICIWRGSLFVPKQHNLP